MKNYELSIIGADSNKMSVASLLSFVISSQAAEGLTIGQMRKRMAICDKLEGLKIGEEISIRGGELKMVNAVYQAHRFGSMHKDFIDVADMLEAAINDEA